MINSIKGRWELHFIAITSVLYLGLALFRLGAADLGSDEARFGVSALNILADYHQLAIVSEDPLGGPGTKPFFYPLCLAASIAIFGRTEFAVRIVNVIGLALAAAVFYIAVASYLKDRFVASLSFAFFLLNPGTLKYARVAMPEPLIVLWGCAGILSAIQFRQKRKLFWACLCGLTLGLGFLTKMWLVLPFVLSCFVLLLLPLENGSSRGRTTGIAIAAVALVVVSAFHLLLALWVAPETFRQWWNTYYIFSFQSRAAGVGFDPVMWYRPWWFYLTTFFKATFFGLPLVLLGILSLAKRRNATLIVVCAILLAPVCYLSFFRVKQATYICPIYPAVALLLALGSIGLWKNVSSGQVAGASALSILLSIGVRVAPDVLRAKEFWAILAVYVLYLILGSQRVWSRRLATGLLLAVSAFFMLSADVIAVRQTLEHRTHYREIAQFFKPSLKAENPRDIVFISPEYPALAFYSFRSGEYWETYYVHRNFDVFLRRLLNRDRLFYVVDPTGVLYGGKASQEEVNALDKHARDVTVDIERSTGQKMMVRVFATGNTQ